MRKGNNKNKTLILSTFAYTAQQTNDYCSHQRALASTPINCERDEAETGPKNNAKSWSRELIAAASTLQAIAMSGIKVRLILVCL